MSDKGDAMRAIFVTEAQMKAHDEVLADELAHKEDAIKILQQQIKALADALEKCEGALICNEEEDSGHWCPHCDSHVDKNFVARNAARAALTLAGRRPQ